MAAPETIKAGFCKEKDLFFLMRIGLLEKHWIEPNNFSMEVFFLKEE